MRLKYYVLLYQEVIEKNNRYIRCVPGWKGEVSIHITYNSRAITHHFSDLDYDVMNLDIIVLNQNRDLLIAKYCLPPAGGNPTTHYTVCDTVVDSGVAWVRRLELDLALVDAITRPFNLMTAGRQGEPRGD